MSMPDWKDALPMPPPGGRLLEMWMTSFEQPDAGLLVEHLLPSLLGTSYSLSQEIQERMLFFGELGTALEQLHGRLTVISSPPRGVRNTSQYPWLWRYVSHFTVGAKAPAVQHAKLWAFHWEVGNEEYLDLYISSTNLNASAFKSQVQAGWQVSVRLNDKFTATARDKWGELIPFIKELGASAGDVAKTRLERLTSLLGRAECPSDVTFVASIPGKNPAASQLKQFKLTGIHVLTPTIGEWSSRTIEDWSNDVGVVFKNLHLKWIAVNHPWAVPSRWTLSQAAGEALLTSGVKIEHVPAEARFTKQHYEADQRWSHAKLYLLCSRKKRRLLVTSANWSIAAWGAGKIKPHNFELGVVFESKWTDLELIDEEFDPPEIIPYYVDRSDDKKGVPALQWAEASWDGNRVALSVRSSDQAMPIVGEVYFSSGAQEPVTFVAGAGELLWVNTVNTPIIAKIIQGNDMLEVDIVDLRPPAEFVKTPLPEVDSDLTKILREVFLLQRYGGPVLDPDFICRNGGKRRRTTLSTDYSVQAWLDARAGFGVIDSWCVALDKAKADPLMLERVKLDGNGLLDIYICRKGPEASLVVEELRWRIEKEE